MRTREKILKIARKKSELRTSDLVKELKIARQSVAKHLKTLVEAGVLVRRGATKSAVYQVVKKGRKVTRQREVTFVKKTEGLEEDRVFNELDVKLGLSDKLNVNSFSALSYAFTEMLNNAIDHSRSNLVKISAGEKSGSIFFEVRDFGIGVYANVRKTFGLKSEFEAVEHVFKGKQTTAPEAHSGEGIFFTSRIADLFVLRSHKLEMRIDNQISDSFLSMKQNIKGTSVSFLISKNAKKRLDSLFKSYTNSDFVFDRSEQRVKIAAFGGALSRSQAKRLLFGLEKFHELTLDFRGVKEIGQGFADEIFRVYGKAHPEKTINFSNANRAVEFMIRRALKNSR